MEATCCCSRKFGLRIADYGMIDGSKPAVPQSAIRIPQLRELLCRLLLCKGLLKAFHRASKNEKPPRKMRIAINRTAIAALVVLCSAFNGQVRAANEEVAVVVKIGCIPRFNDKEKVIQTAGKEDNL